MSESESVDAPRAAEEEGAADESSAESAGASSTTITPSPCNGDVESTVTSRSDETGDLLENNTEEIKREEEDHGENDSGDAETRTSYASITSTGIVGDRSPSHAQTVPVGATDRRGQSEFAKVRLNEAMQREKEEDIDVHDADTTENEEKTVESSDWDPNNSRRDGVKTSGAALAAVQREGIPGAYDANRRAPYLPMRRERRCVRDDSNATTANDLRGGPAPPSDTPAPALLLDGNISPPDDPIEAFTVSEETRHHDRIEEAIRRRVLDGALRISDRAVKTITIDSSRRDAMSTDEQTAAVKCGGFFNRHPRRLSYAVAVLVFVAIAVGVALGVMYEPSSGTDSAGEPSGNAPPKSSVAPSIASPAPSMVPSLSASPTAEPSEMPSMAPSLSASPSPYPSNVPSKAPTTERFQTIKKTLEGISSKPALVNTSSPQYRAMVWLADEDERHVDISDKENLAQRYVLATLYFSTGGDAWVDNSSFLSSDHECFWNTNSTDYYWGFKGCGCNLSTSFEVSAIYLDENNLKGSLPEELGHLPMLSRLHLEHNEISGSIPSLIHSLKNLTVLFLASNQFKGSISGSIGDMSNLIALDLRDNLLSGPVPTSVGKLSRLKYLSLSMNSLIGKIPYSIGSMSELLVLDAGVNQFTGTIPSSMEKMSNLTHLFLELNSLSGAVPRFIGHLPQLQMLSLSFNILSGAIPSSIGQLPMLSYLDLTSNALSGTIPSCINNLTTLQRMWLDRNRLNGTLPFISGRFLDLILFAVDDNSLTGPIPTSIYTYSNLTLVGLSKNRLGGTLSPFLGNISGLQHFAAAENSLTGTIPPEISTLAHLSTFVVSSNQLNGTLPSDIGHGSISNNITAFSVSSNRLNGAIPETIAQMSLLEFLYLDQNLFSGTLPTSFARLTALKGLLLQGNHLTGGIDFMCNISISVLTADCLDPAPEVNCTCCQWCCHDIHGCEVT